MFLAVRPRNEECFNQFIQVNCEMTLRVLCTDLNVNFNALEMMLGISQSLCQLDPTETHTNIERLLNTNLAGPTEPL